MTIVISKSINLDSIKLKLLYEIQMAQISVDPLMALDWNDQLNQKKLKWINK